MAKVPAIRHGDVVVTEGAANGANLNWGVNMMHPVDGRPAFARYPDLLGERPALTRANQLDDALAATLG